MTKTKLKRLLRRTDLGKLTQEMLLQEFMEECPEEKREKFNQLLEIEDFDTLIQAINDL